MPLEVAALADVLLGWQYAAGLLVGAPILVAIMAVLVRLTLPDDLADAAIQRARDVEGHDMGSAEGLPR